MSNLVNAFDFENVRAFKIKPCLMKLTIQPDFSIPSIPYIAPPTTDADGNFIDVSICQAEYPTQAPPPYGSQAPAPQLHLLSEQGFKPVRGTLTEGRYLTFESNGYALSIDPAESSQFIATEATSAHEDINQRWIVHVLEEGGTKFNISSAANGMWISQHTSLTHAVSGAEVYTIDFGSAGYTLQKENGDFLTFDGEGNVVISSSAVGFEAYSVTYST
jgi:phospholipase C